MSRTVYRSDLKEGQVVRVNGYVPEAGEDKDNAFGVQIDLDPAGSGISVMKWA